MVKFGPSPTKAVAMSRRMRLHPHADVTGRRHDHGTSGEREISGGLEAAADAGGDGKAARFVITIPHRNSLTNDCPLGSSRSPATVTGPGIYTVPEAAHLGKVTLRRIQFHSISVRITNAS